jgi:hypothetical protein
VICPRCKGPAVRVHQSGDLSCVRQCNETPTEELVRKELEGLTASLARLVGSHVPPGFIFTLILSTADEDGVKRSGAMAYASSGQRPDIVSMLREMADKLESGRMPA